MRRSLLLVNDGQTLQLSSAMKLAMAMLGQQQVRAWADNSSVMMLGGTPLPPLTPTFGGYRAVDDTGNHVPLTFSYALPVARIITADDLLRNGDGGATLHGKIVIVGRTIAIKPIGGLVRGFAATRDGTFAPGFHSLDLRRSAAGLWPQQLYQYEVVPTAATDNVARLYGSAYINHRPVKTAPRSVQEAARMVLWYDALAYLFDTDVSGRTTLRDADGLMSLSGTAGLDLTTALHGAE